MRKVSSAVLAVLLLLLLPVVAFAHPGGTDSQGGHQNGTGQYHYHHGYPAHQHTDGQCPYDFDDRTGYNSGNNSLSESKSTTYTNVSAMKREAKNEDNGRDDWMLWVGGVLIMAIAILIWCIRITNRERKETEELLELSLSRLQTAIEYTEVDLYKGVVYIDKSLCGKLYHHSSFCCNKERNNKIMHKMIVASKVTAEEILHLTACPACTKEPQPEVDPIVYIGTTPNSYLYHTKSCRSFPVTAIPSRLSVAQQMHKSRCLVCNPPSKGLDVWH